MPPPLPPPEEENEDYNSASDSDFDASLSPSSGEESEANNREPRRGKSAKRRADNEGDLEMVSGDEGVVAQGRKKRRKKAEGNDIENHKGTAGEEEEPEGGVGVRVRLRSGRGGEEKTKQIRQTSAATVDIDSIWDRMNNPAPSKDAPPSQSPDTTSTQASTTVNLPTADAPRILPTTETITIPHTYTFAGATHVSTKRVAVNSPEALTYLASHNTHHSSPPKAMSALRRPLARKNLLDPNPTCLVNSRQLPRRSDLPPSIGGNGSKSLAANARVSEWANGVRGKAKKLNTVEKSKVDWEAEVERQGLKEELERAEKSGTNYLGRMEFLERVEGGLEEEGRRWRMRGKT